MRNMKIPFTSSLLNLTEINPSFDTGIMRVAYTGRNRNNSFISKAAFEQCIESIYNVPVVANYTRDDNSIGGHDMELVQKGDEVKLVALTQPVGVVPAGAKWYWDLVEDDSGIHEYLCVEVLIWKRQECYDKIKEDGFEKQSMEITVTDGEMINGCYEIREFYFTALTLLGDDVEPCFESAGLTMFQKDYFAEELQKMKDDFAKEFSKINQKEEEQPMDEKLALIEQYHFKLEDLEFNVDELSYDDLKAKLDEMTAQTDPEPKGDETYSLNLNEFLDEIYAQLDTVKYVDRWGYESVKYWFMDLQDNEVICCNCEDRYRTYGVPVVMSGDKVTLDFACAKRKKVKYEDYLETDTMPEDAQFEKLIVETMEHAISEKDNANAAFAELTEQFNTLKTNMEDVQAKYKELFDADEQRKYEKQKAEKESVFEQFEDELANETSYQELKSNMDKFSCEEIQEKCYAIFGKKKATAVFSTKPNKKPAVMVGTTQGSSESSAYGDLFDFKKK
jgi:hypothetical protein